MPLVSLPPLADDEVGTVSPLGDNPALDVESLFAAIGLGPILAAKPTLHKYQLQRAAKTPEELRRRILRFVASDTFAEAKDVPAFDYDEVLRLVSQAQREGGVAHLDDAQARALVAVAPADMADDLAVQANRILAWANPLIPRDSRPAVIGARPEEPDAHSTADFRRVWQVAIDPWSVLDDLEDGSLSDDQVAALMINYPQFYGELRQAITEEMGAMEGRRGKKWEPLPQKAALLATIMQTQSMDLELAGAVQAMYAQQPNATPPVSAAARRKGGGGGDATDAMTPGQKAAGGDA